MVIAELSSYSRSQGALSDLCALTKLEKHAAYLAQHRSEQRRLSDMELGYVKRCVTYTTNLHTSYQQLTDEHYRSSVLQYLPSPMQGLDDGPVGGPNAPGGMSMCGVWVI